MNLKTNLNTMVLMSLFFSAHVLSITIYDIDSLVSFAQLNNGKSVYADSDGKLHEVVVRASGEIISDDAIPLLNGIKVSKVLPYGPNGLIAQGENKDVYAVLNVYDPISPRIIVANNVDLIDIAVTQNQVFMLNTAGDIWGENIISGKSGSIVSDKALSSVKRMIGVGEHLVLYFANGDIIKVPIIDDSQVSYDDNVRIGSDWPDAQIAPFNDDYFVLKSQSDYVRLRKVSNVTYQSVEEHDRLLGAFRQSFELPSGDILFERDNLFVASTKLVTKRRQFLSSPLIGGHRVNLTVNKMYGGVYPNCPLVSDYRNDRGFDVDPWWIGVKLDQSYYQNIPSVIKAELARHAIKENHVDIFVLIQRNLVLGERDDHDDDNSPFTSRIKLHSWADPHAPEQFDGERIERNFLIGIFEPDVDTIKAGEDKWALEVGSLKPFWVNVHDGAWSPQTARIQISSLLEPGVPISQSFWSLAIDHENPARKRAAVTLHALLSIDESTLLDDHNRGQAALKNLEALAEKIYELFPDHGLATKLRMLLAH